MILEPYQMRLMGRELDSVVAAAFANNLANFHRRHRVNAHNEVSIPQYWAETVYNGLKKMKRSFPQLKFGNVMEDKNRLKFFTIPTHNPVEKMRVELYNAVDTLIIETIDNFAKSDKKPFFLS